MPSRAVSTARSHFLKRPILYGALSMFAVLVPVYCLSIGLRASRGAAITGDEPFYLITTQSILDDFGAITDSPGKEIDFHFVHHLHGVCTTPAQVAQRIAGITKKEITAAAGKLRLDTVFVLTKALQSAKL